MLLLSQLIQMVNGYFGEAKWNYVHLSIRLKEEIYLL